MGTDPATAQAICIIFACYSRIMRHFKMYTLGTDLVSGQWSGVSGQAAPKLQNSQKRKQPPNQNRRGSWELNKAGGGLATSAKTAALNLCRACLPLLRPFSCASCISRFTPNCDFFTNHIDFCQQNMLYYSSKGMKRC